MQITARTTETQADSRIKRERERRNPPWGVRPLLHACAAIMMCSLMSCTVINITTIDGAPMSAHYPDPDAQSAEESVYLIESFMRKRQIGPNERYRFMRYFAPFIPSNADIGADEFVFLGSRAIRPKQPYPVLACAENRALVRAVKDWLGTPYKWGGCSPGGVDCSCLVQAIYEEAYGIHLSRTSARIFYDDLYLVDKEEMREGDIVFFKTNGNRISHIGVYLADGAFVHASQSTGVRISRLDQRYYRKRFVAAGRVKRVRPADAPAVTLCRLTVLNR